MDKERIDGFRSAFAVSDHYALEFMRFLQGQGIRGPEDVQIIGFDDTLASRESVPALTTIHQDAALRARTAIRRLEALRDGPPAMPASFCRWSWWNGKAQGGCHVRLYAKSPFRSPYRECCKPPFLSWIRS